MGPSGWLAWRSTVSASAAARGQFEELMVVMEYRPMHFLNRKRSLGVPTAW
jgi:hypothetical protein